MTMDFTQEERNAAANALALRQEGTSSTCMTAELVTLQCELTRALDRLEVSDTALSFAVGLIKEYDPKAKVSEAAMKKEAVMELAAAKTSR